MPRAPFDALPLSSTQEDTDQNESVSKFETHLFSITFCSVRFGFLFVFLLQKKFHFYFVPDLVSEIVPR